MICSSAPTLGSAHLAVAAEPVKCTGLLPVAAPTAPMFNSGLDTDSMVRELPKFEQLHDCCICNCAAMELVRYDPQVGFMPALKTYRCPECGHVVTTEVDEPGGSKAA